MKRRHLQFKVRTWLLLVLLPALTAVSVGIGIDVYRGLRALILGGFDHELAGVSVVTAAFTDPVKHTWLAEERRVRDPVYLPEGDVFVAFAADRPGDHLVTIRAADGIMADHPVTLGEPLRDLAYVPAAGELLGLDSRGALQQVDPTTGALRALPWTPADLAQIATDHGKGELLGVVGSQVVRIDLASQQVEVIRPVPAPEEQPDLLGSTDGETIWFNNQAHAHFVMLGADEAADAEYPWQGGMPAPTQIAFDTRRERWVEAAEQLHALDLTAAVELAGDYAAAYGREASPTYQRMVAPMRRLRERLGLTYLYTQEVRNHRDITYILDSSTDDEHSPLLSQDELPESEVEGVDHLLRDGALHFTKIQRWEQWGWLKSAFAPIYAGTGEVIAMAGADVNVSVISQRTRSALLAVFLLGAGSLVLASLWSLKVAEWLRRPVEELKRGAMSVATGDYREIRVKGALEFETLTHIFNEVGGNMTVSMSNLTHEIARLLRSRDQAEVRRVFRHQQEVALVLADVEDVEIGAQQSNRGGACADRGVVWVWWEDAETDEDEVAQLARRSGMPARLRARIGGEDAATAVRHWPEGLRAVVRLEVKRRQAVVWRRREPAESAVPMVRVGDDGATELGWAEWGPILLVRNMAVREVVV